MQKTLILILVAGCLLVASCRAGRGCPTNGKNIGAERILSGDPKALKAAGKAGKFRH